MEHKNGYIYIRESEIMDRHNICELGKSIDLFDTERNFSKFRLGSKFTLVI